MTALNSNPALGKAVSVDHGTPPTPEYLQSCASAVVSLRRIGETSEKFNWHIRKLLGHLRAMKGAHGEQVSIVPGEPMERSELLTTMTEFVRSGIFDDWDLDNEDSHWFNPDQIAYLQSTIIAHS